MNPPADGIRLVNSIRLLPVARIAIIAITNAHGAIVPIAITIAGIVRNTLSAGAMFASVLDVVSNSPSDPDWELVGLSLQAGRLGYRFTHRRKPPVHSRRS